MARYVEFTAGGVRVDLNRYLNSERGKEALRRIDEQSKMFERTESVDLPYAKSQALVIKRIANGLERTGLATKNNTLVDYGNHLQIEAGYLMGALGMTKEDDENSKE
jgi:hypothetical protein